MTINKAYLVALRATVTLSYIPVMTPGLFDKIPGPPETFLGHIRQFPGPFFMEIFFPVLQLLKHIINVNSCFSIYLSEE